MRLHFLVALIWALLSASPAHAAWSDAWTLSGVSSGAISSLTIPTSHLVNDFSSPVKCDSPGGCTLTILNGGSVSVQVFVSGTWSESNSADFIDGNTTLLTNGKVLDIPRGRWVRLKVLVAATVAGTASFTGN